MKGCNIYPCTIKHYSLAPYNDFTVEILNRYIMLGRGICEKYQSRDEKFPEPKGEGNLVSRLVFFANTPPSMIYLFNYTEYYLEHWLNK